MVESKENQSLSTRKIKNEHLVTVLLCALTIPLSMSMWILNLVYSKFISGDNDFSEPVVIPPTRWLASCIIPLLFAIHGYKKKSVSVSGALLGYMFAFIFTLSNYCFLIALCTFFVTGSKTTKFKSHLKRKFEEDFKEGGQRNWVQVLCNAGMALQLSLLYILDVGATERPVDFVKDYRASWLAMGVLGVFACCNGDTWGSELGTVLSTSDPYLITTLKKVPRGTNGGVSVLGTLMSACGGLVVGITYYLGLLVFADKTMYLYAPLQWPIILYGAAAGFFGSLLDSFLGATLQYSGIDNNGKIVSHSSAAEKHISGRNILDNHSVNLITTVIIGVLMPTVAKTFWPGL